MAQCDRASGDVISGGMSTGKKEKIRALRHPANDTLPRGTHHNMAEY